MEQRNWKPSPSADVSADAAPDLASYRALFYERYASTHVIHRDGVATVDVFRRLGKVWRSHFAQVLPKNHEAKIVDVGCGNGALVWWLQREGFTQVEGVDFSAEQVEIARQLGVKDIVQGDLRVFLGSREGCYDTIILRDVLEHFTKLETMEILELCRQALEPGGRLVLQVPNAESPFFGRIRYGDFTHEIAYSASSLMQLLAVMGFADVQCLPTPPVAMSRKALLRIPLWFLIELFYKILLFAELGKGDRILTQGIIAVARRLP